MLSLSQVRERVASRFSEVEQVDESILRFTRTQAAVPFAVYYLDITENLPLTFNTLTEYQDRVIGRRYFNGRKSLQWNNYLYFLTSVERLATREFRIAKELIERDRRFARKFVILEDELESVLTSPVVAPADVTVQQNVLSVWTNRLVEAGLDRAILSDDDLPIRLKMIETAGSAGPLRVRARRQHVDTTPIPFVRSLDLHKFREFPLQKHFDFGAVNLIFGTNGAGKTSLLEAIELFYCGRNKRNPKSSPSYDLAAFLGDGRLEVATDNRQLQDFRDRNLAWYGISEVNTNKLSLSFARFNFLDTDAAVGLADTTTELVEDLSKLLVGSEASKTWRDIQRVSEAVTEKLRSLRPLIQQINDEIEQVERLLNVAGEIPQESDSIQRRLEQMIHRTGWDLTPGDKDAVVARLVEELSELGSLAQQAAELHWTASPVTSAGLADYVRRVNHIVDKAEPEMNQLEARRKNETRLDDMLKRHREAADLVEEAKRLLSAGLADRADEAKDLQAAMHTFSGWLAGQNGDSLREIAPIELDTTVVQYHDAAVSKRSVAENSLAEMQREYSTLRKLRDESQALAQELREVAGRILRSSPNPDQCPLCHTDFGQGELALHIGAGIDQHVEPLGQALLNQLREREAMLHDAAAAAAVSDWLRRFCERAGLADPTSVRSALSEIETVTRKLEQMRDRLEGLNREMLALEAEGLSLARLDRVSKRLSELGYALDQSTPEAANRVLSTINDASMVSSRNLMEEREETARLEKSLQAMMDTPESGVNLRKILYTMKERLAATKSLQAKLSVLSSSYPWAAERPLAELAVEAESVRKVAAEVQATIGREQQLRLSFTESTKRKAHLAQQLEVFQPQLERFTAAQSVLQSLRTEHSLQAGMEMALQQNRDAIETIFARIHSPAEFSRLGSNWSTLVRKAGGSEAKLTEISTGQRAAFALSIFLAQNAQLTVAPPVMLIDDPIAHVDDLNSLSFLDYLREVVLTGRRQIFFATANDKLATLFERKFDFLGGEFRRFNLERTRTSAE